ncbi:hypothetical protein AB9K33_15725 [Citrobacter freundii]
MFISTLNHYNKIELDHPTIKNFIRENKIKNIIKFINPLLKIGLIVMNDRTISIYPARFRFEKINNIIYGGENNSGRFERWYTQQMAIE